MQDVIVTVLGIQTDADGDKTRIETVANGKMRQKDGMHYITYRERQEDGTEVATLIKANETAMTLVRHGQVVHEQRFEQAKRENGTYKTPYGTIRMAVDTHSFILSMTELSGSIFLTYDLHVEGQWQSHNELSIKISRDHTLNVQ
ncbi:MAG: DUF1934 domain-containing protein [Selenomonadales bacterium]|nr:DUF1934 domain-containing protein [Selenomonadales bacterium]